MKIPSRKFRLSVFLPKYWLQNQPVEHLWDTTLNAMIDRGEPFTNIAANPLDRFNADIGGYHVWIQNHPYASFTYRNHGVSRQTVIRAKLWLDECIRNAHGS